MFKDVGEHLAAQCDGEGFERRLRELGERVDLPEDHHGIDGHGVATGDPGNTRPERDDKQLPCHARCLRSADAVEPAATNYPPEQKSRHSGSQRRQNE